MKKNACKFLVAVYAVSVFQFTAVAQIDLLSTQINFRTTQAADFAATTQHNGRMNIIGTSATGSPYAFPANRIGYSSLTVTENAPTGTAIAGVNPNTNTGAGGYFSGGQYGVYGISWATDTTAYHYGGRFYAAKGRYNFGIRSTAPAKPGSYAGYFEGILLCTQNPIVYSDDKLKSKEEDLSGSLGKILRLKPKSYEYTTAGKWKEAFAPKRHFGFIAQQVEQVFPEMVTDVTPPTDSPEDDPDKNLSRVQETYKAVDYVALVPILVSAIQEQQQQIDELKKANITIRNQMNKLQAK